MIKALVKFTLVPGWKCPKSLPLPPSRTATCRDTENQVSVCISVNWHHFTVEIYDSNHVLQRTMSSVENSESLFESYFYHANNWRVKDPQSSFLFGYTEIFSACEVAITKLTPDARPQIIAEVRQGDSDELMTIKSLIGKRHLERVRQIDLPEKSLTKLLKAREKLATTTGDWRGGSIVAVYDRNHHWVRDRDFDGFLNGNPVDQTICALSAFNDMRNAIVQKRAWHSKYLVMPNSDNSTEMGRLSKEQLDALWAAVQLKNPFETTFSEYSRDYLARLRYFADFKSQMGVLSPSSGAAGPDRMRDSQGRFAPRVDIAAMIRRNLPPPPPRPVVPQNFLDKKCENKELSQMLRQVQAELACAEALLKAPVPPIAIAPKPTPAPEPEVVAEVAAVVAAEHGYVTAQVLCTDEVSAMSSFEELASWADSLLTAPKDWLLSDSDSDDEPTTIKRQKLD